MLSIISKNGKEYLKVARKSWKSYLDIKSPHRYYDYNITQCSFDNKKDAWCNTCNSGIGSWSESCVNTITSLNLKKYEDILKKKDEENKKEYHYYEIEIYRNDKNGTI
jgi:hypothetical protein